MGCGADGDNGEPAVRANVPRAALVPPPLLFGLTFLVGFFVQRRVWPVTTSALPRPVQGIGWLVAAAGLVMALWSIALFLHDRTTIVPHGASARLVIRGPYRFTRNPMYVSLSLEYLGMALLVQAGLSAALIVVPLLFIHRIIIPIEEAQLRARFGDAYVAYCAHVRRWL